LLWEKGSTYIKEIHGLGSMNLQRPCKILMFVNTVADSHVCWKIVPSNFFGWL